ncbi:response regulator transcription factor [Ectobacillus ponti]|uniref:Response regulator transcription factor n=1 Tax=Ectobacillus ponti TaxID=2961894 RepID=A0AA41XBQ7_9BACI|nr:response regulator transcription factor [Ectobacillus ponti]MCP8970035.1 response regulator transcription factor [Ectobacillus ponti]
MLKILIVDDEMLERKAVAKILTASLADAEVVGEAQNGRKAIEMAALHEPDIIFMDIKMPGIDGLQAVKAIKETNETVKFIMVSAYNTFEYAKEAMQQGVKEYILKPSSPQDILAAVERVSAEIAAERKQRQEQQSLRDNLDRAVSIAQKEWVSSLLLNQVQDITFDEWGQLLGIEITSGHIMLFALEPALPAEERQRFCGWLKDALGQLVKKQEIMMGPMSDMQVPVLFLDKERTQFRATAQAIVEGVLQQFRQAGFAAELRIGIGQSYNQAHKLNQSYHEAAAALKQLAKTTGQPYFFSGRQEAAEAQSPSAFLEVEKKLLDAVRQGDLNQLLLLFEAFVLQSGHSLEPAAVRESFQELFVLVSRMLHEFGISGERTPRLETNDMAQLFEQCKTYLASVTRQVQAWRNNHAKGLLHKAKEYIEKHYADLITLEAVAEYVDLSPYYFSKLFKDRFGMTFIDYVTEIRIQRAKEEIADPQKSLKEICFAVGYKDPNYFSRVFKKHTGLSPSQFRRAALHEETI